MSDKLNLEHVLLTRVAPFVVNVQLNRPNQRNALNGRLWHEIGQVFKFLDTDPDTRVVILSGNGRVFCAGLDLKESQEIMGPQDDHETDLARKARKLREKILELQESFNLVEACSKPVIAAIHGACVGGGIDLVCCCDIRIASGKTIFSVKEVDIGLAADTGSLNRLPKICGNESWIKDISYTARIFDEKEAFQYSLISKIYETKEEVMKAALEMATVIAEKSPVAVQGTKMTLNYSRDHTVSDSLHFIANWNMSQLMTEDVAKAALASITKQPAPEFSKL